MWYTKISWVHLFSRSISLTIANLSFNGLKLDLLYILCHGNSASIEINSTHFFFETFIAVVFVVSEDFENFKGKKLPNDNLNKMERRAVSDLRKREDIIITKADKGGAMYSYYWCLKLHKRGELTTWKHWILPKVKPLLNRRLFQHCQ